MHIYMCIYIYIYVERERESDAPSHQEPPGIGDTNLPTKIIPAKIP